MKNRNRKRDGATIPEFAACFTAFFFCILIPCLNIVSFAASYALAQSTSYIIADRLSNEQNLESLERAMEKTKLDLKNSDSLRTFRVSPDREKSIHLEIAVEDLKGNEKLIEFNNLLKQRRLDKEIPSAKTENGIYRYRVTTKFVSSPVVDLRAIPLVGNLPIVCEPTPISIVTYRSAEHPEILTR